MFDEVCVMHIKSRNNERTSHASVSFRSFKPGTTPLTRGILTLLQKLQLQIFLTHKELKILKRPLLLQIDPIQVP